MEGTQMKARFSTGLRVAAWSASSLLIVGAVAGTASAATHHAKQVVKHKVAKDATNGASSSGSSGSGAAPGAPPRMLHGSETVETTDGTFETYVSQVGTVSAVSATSITVASADDYSATYAIDDDTVVVKDGAKSDTSAVANGDTVMVRGEQEDDAVTAEAILDGKPTKPTGGQGGPGGRPGPGGPGFGGPPPAGAGGAGEASGS
jgi:Domain of unknown function (DUF5666)